VNSISNAQCFLSFPLPLTPSVCLLHSPHAHLQSAHCLSLTLSLCCSAANISACTYDRECVRARELYGEILPGACRPLIKLAPSRQIHITATTLCTYKLFGPHNERESRIQPAAAARSLLLLL